MHNQDRQLISSIKDQALCLIFNVLRLTPQPKGGLRLCEASLGDALRGH